MCSICFPQTKIIIIPKELELTLTFFNLYKEKRKAIKQGDLNELNRLKRQCLELFIPEKEEQIIF